MHHGHHRSLISICLLAALLLLAACSQNIYLYYGDTSQRYYDALKRPETTETYKRSLELVFARSYAKGLPVPPGLYCDYAMLLLKDGDNSGAREYLIKEQEQWPESAQLVEFLFTRYALRR